MDAISAHSSSFFCFSVCVCVNVYVILVYVCVYVFVYIYVFDSNAYVYICISRLTFKFNIETRRYVFSGPGAAQSPSVFKHNHTLRIPAVPTIEGKYRSTIRDIEIQLGMLIVPLRENQSGNVIKALVR